MDFPKQTPPLSRASVTEGVHWKRVAEIWATPYFTLDGDQPVHASDMCRGLADDGWLLGAIATLGTSERLLRQVIPLPTFHPYGILQQGHAVADTRCTCQVLGLGSPS